MREVLQNTTRKFKIFMADAAAPSSGKTDLTTFIVYLCKDNDTDVIVTANITIVNRGHGWYEVTPAASMRNTLGDNAWTFTAVGAVDCPHLETVIAADAQLVAWGAATVTDLSGLATADQINALQINTRANLSVPQTIVIPEAGTTIIRIVLTLFDEIGEMEAPDSTPTITLTNISGTSLGGRLSAPANPTVGLYYWDYTSSAGDAVEQLLWQFTVIENTDMRVYVASSNVVAASTGSGNATLENQELMLAGLGDISVRQSGHIRAAGFSDS